MIARLLSFLGVPPTPDAGMPLAIRACADLVLSTNGYQRLVRIRDEVPRASLEDFDAMLLFAARELADRGKLGSAGRVLVMRGMPQRASVGARP